MMLTKPNHEATGRQARCFLEQFRNDSDFTKGEMDDIARHISEALGHDILSDRFRWGRIRNGKVSRLYEEEADVLRFMKSYRPELISCVQQEGNIRSVIENLVGSSSMHAETMMPMKRLAYKRHKLLELAFPFVTFYVADKHNFAQIAGEVFAEVLKGSNHNGLVGISGGTVQLNIAHEYVRQNPSCGSVLPRFLSLNDLCHNDYRLTRSADSVAAQMSYVFKTESYAVSDTSDYERRLNECKVFLLSAGGTEDSFMIENVPTLRFSRQYCGDFAYLPVDRHATRFQHYEADKFLSKYLCYGTPDHIRSCSDARIILLLNSISKLAVGRAVLEAGLVNVVVLIDDLASLLYQSAKHR